VQDKVQWRNLMRSWHCQAEVGMLSSSGRWAFCDKGDGRHQMSRSLLIMWADHYFSRMENKP
jgi:hypothetical protein